MSQINTGHRFVDRERNIDDVKLNNMLDLATVSPELISAQTVTNVAAAGDSFLLLKSGGTLAKILQSDMFANLPLADATKNGQLKQLSGNVTDYVGGDNNCHVLGGPTTHYYDYDDFVGGVVTGTNTGATKLCMFSTSGASGAAAGPWSGSSFGAGRPGVIQLTPGAAASAYARLYTPGPIFLGNGTITWRMWVDINNAAAGATTQHLFGLNSAVNGVVLATGYYILLYFAASASVNWQWQVRSAAALSTGDTGVVATRNVWFDLKIIATTTLVQFFINGVQVGGNITTNIPPASQALYPSLVMASANDTANYNVFADACEIDIDTGIAGKFSRSPI
jgi:hypothetical protein